MVMRPWQGCVLNPETGRAIKIGSNTYLRLVRKGIIEPEGPFVVAKPQVSGPSSSTYDGETESDVPEEEEKQAEEAEGGGEAEAEAEATEEENLSDSGEFEKPPDGEIEKTSYEDLAGEKPPMGGFDDFQPGDATETDNAEETEDDVPQSLPSNSPEATPVGDGLDKNGDGKLDEDEIRDGLQGALDEVRLIDDLASNQSAQVLEADTDDFTDEFTDGEPEIYEDDPGFNFGGPRPSSNQLTLDNASDEEMEDGPFSASAPPFLNAPMPESPFGNNPALQAFNSLRNELNQLKEDIEEEKRDNADVDMKQLSVTQEPAADVEMKQAAAFTGRSELPELTSEVEKRPPQTEMASARPNKRQRLDPFNPSMPIDTTLPDPSKLPTIPAEAFRDMVDPGLRQQDRLMIDAPGVDQKLLTSEEPDTRDLDDTTDEESTDDETDGELNPSPFPAFDAEKAAQGISLAAKLKAAKLDKASVEFPSTLPKAGPGAQNVNEGCPAIELFDLKSGTPTQKYMDTFMLRMKQVLDESAFSESQKREIFKNLTRKITLLVHPDKNIMCKDDANNLFQTLNLGTFEQTNDILQPFDTESYKRQMLGLKKRRIF